MSDSRALAALLLGAAIGVGVGILLAPDKGSETRAKLKKEGKKVADTLQEKMKEGKERVGAWTDKMASRYSAHDGDTL